MLFSYKNRPLSEPRMKIVVFLLFFVLIAYGQQTSVAVLPSDGTAISNDGLDALTDEMRVAALKVLPTNTFAVLTRDVVIKRLGGAEKYIQECKESTCIVNLGKKAQVDYVSQASVSKLDKKIRLKVELYNVRSEALVGMFTDEAGDIRGLLDIVKKKVSTDVFSKIPGASVDSKAAQQPQTNFLERGILFASRGDYEIAIEEFTEALKQQPNNGAIYAHRGNAYQKKGGLDEAIEDYNQAIKLVPNDAKTYNNRCHAYSIKGIVEKFIKMLENTNEDELTQNQGNAYLDKAIADCNQAIRLVPNYAEAYVNRGDVYKDKGNRDKAIADYNQAIKLAPNYAEAYFKRGFIYRDSNHDKAIADYSRAIKLDPNNTTLGVYVERGKVYEKKGDYDKAIADFGQAIKQNPNDANAYDSRGDAYFQKNDYDKAIADYNQAIRLNPNYDDAYFDRGAAYFQKNDYDKAIADYNQAIRLNPNYDDAYFDRGLAYYKKGDYDKAIADFSQVIRLVPDNAKAYVNRGSAYAQKNDYDKAIANYKQAIRLDPNNEPARQGLEIMQRAKRTR